MYIRFLGYEIQKLGASSENGFGLKYIDTSSLEFGRKIDTVEPELVATNTNDQSHEEEQISSSLLVSSSETVQIETSLNDQDLVKPSRVKKRNFSSKDPSKSANILKSHIDSNNFRHTSKLTTDEEVRANLKLISLIYSIFNFAHRISLLVKLLLFFQIIKPPLAIGNSVGIPFGAKTKTTRVVESSTEPIKDEVSDIKTKLTTRAPITPKFIPFGQKTKTTAASPITSTSLRTSSTPRSTEEPTKHSTLSSLQDTTAKLRFGQKFPKTTSETKTSAITTASTTKRSTTTPLAVTRTSTSSTTTTSSPTSTKRRLIKSTTVTSTPLNTSRRRSTTQVFYTNCIRIFSS